MERNAKGHFVGGASGNPAGRPAGSRNRTTMAAAALLDGEAARLTRKAVDLALAGDTTALRLCLERIIPPRRNNMVQLALPDLTDFSGLSEAHGVLVRAASSGQLALSDAEVLQGLLEAHRRFLETRELEERLASVEARLRSLRR